MCQSSEKFVLEGTDNQLNLGRRPSLQKQDKKWEILLELSLNGKVIRKYLNSISRRRPFSMKMSSMMKVFGVQIVICLQKMCATAGLYQEV